MADQEEDKKDVEEKDETAEGNTDEQEFDEAFEEAVTEGEADTETEEKAEGQDKSAEKEEEEEKKESKEDQEDIDWKARAEAAEADRVKVEQKMKSWEGRITAANKRADDFEKKLQERDSTQAKSSGKSEAIPGGEDDEIVLKDFVEEFPSLEKPIKALAKKIATKIVEDKFKDIEPRIEKVSQKIEPIEKRMQEAEGVAHFDTISKSHSDWREIRDSGKLTSWIEAQPAIVRSSLERVAREGSTEEVIELFSAYKGNKSNNTSTTPRGKSPSKKAQDLLAVDSSASGSPKGKAKLDKDSFDAGWEEALRD